MLKIKAIYANTESLEVRNSIFEKTHALLEGGAMVIDTAWMAKSNHHIENSIFTMATSKKGGAIYYGISGGTDIGKKSVSPASGLLRGLRFESCVATEAAGAVYCDDVEVHVDNSNFFNCTAGQFGGAILTNTGTVNISASSFENCRVQADIQTDVCFRLILTSTIGTRGWNGNVLYVLEPHWADTIANEFDPRSACMLTPQNLPSK